MNPAITYWVRINKQAAIKNGVSLLPLNISTGNGTPAEMYSALQHNYPKFFKMDLLCKWAWLGAESLLSLQTGFLYEGMDKAKIGLMLMTSHGCLDVDKKYLSSIATIPSPALFVYTLPNIMLGEICIRHGFKGEQLCLMSDNFDAEELQFYVKDMLDNRGMEACLCGWVDVTETTQDVCMFWVSKDKYGTTLSPAALQQVYNG